MKVEWMEYPVSIGGEDEQMTITWKDGSTEIVPAHDGDGETLFQLPRLMEEIFRIEYFNCSVGQSAKFVDEFPALFRSPSGVLVLRVSAGEDFMNAFICKSRNAGECLLSWIRGDLRDALNDLDFPPSGVTADHWVSVREVMSFIAYGLLDEFPLIAFDPSKDAENQGAFDATVENLGLVKVEMPWWQPPTREGPRFAFPASVFYEETYETLPTLETAEDPSIAVSVTHRLEQGEWERLLDGCKSGSIAERVVGNIGHHGGRFEHLRALAPEVGQLFLTRWRELY